MSGKKPHLCVLVEFGLEVNDGMGDRRSGKTGPVGIEDQGEELIVSFAWRGNRLTAAILMFLVFAALTPFSIKHWECVFTMGLSCYGALHYTVLTCAVAIASPVSLYAAVAFVVNRTEIVFSVRGADYRITGIPWPGAGLLPREMIEGTWIKEHKPTADRAAGSHSTYSLYLVKKRGTKRVFGTFREIVEAEELAARIRAALKIVATDAG